MAKSKKVLIFVAIFIAFALFTGFAYRNELFKLDQSKLSDMQQANGMQVYKDDQFEYCYKSDGTIFTIKNIVDYDQVKLTKVELTEGQAADVVFDIANKYINGLDRNRLNIETTKRNGPEPWMIIIQNISEPNNVILGSILAYVNEYGILSYACFDGNLQSDIKTEAQLNLISEEKAIEIAYASAQKIAEDIVQNRNAISNIESDIKETDEKIVTDDGEILENSQSDQAIDMKFAFNRNTENVKADLYVRNGKYFYLVEISNVKQEFSNGNVLERSFWVEIDAESEEVVSSTICK